MTKMTRVTVSAMLPDLPSAHAWQSATGEASNTKAAISRAFGVLLKRAKGKHIHSIKAEIIITKVDKEEA